MIAQLKYIGEHIFLETGSIFFISDPSSLARRGIISIYDHAITSGK
jgi:hypothetical protein